MSSRVRRVAKTEQSVSLINTVLNLFASSVVDASARLALGRIRLAVVPLLNSRLAASSLASLDGRIRYVPIVMPHHRLSAYRETFRLNKTDRVFDCTPQLDFDLFVVGRIEDQLGEYVRGIGLSAAHLVGLGATQEHIVEFKAILASVEERVLADGMPGLQSPGENGSTGAYWSKIGSMLNRQGPAQATPNESHAGDPGSDRAAPSDPPEIIMINPLDRQSQHIGRTADGRQFFLTMPFEPARSDDSRGSEFVALYLFDDAGTLLDAKIDDFGPRADMDVEKRNAIYEQRLTGLGDVSIEGILIAPFAIDRFGTTFGFIPRRPDYDAVDVMPGNYMAFFPPWDSGDYES